MRKKSQKKKTTRICDHKILLRASVPRLLAFLALCFHLFVFPFVLFFGFLYLRSLLWRLSASDSIHQNLPIQYFPNRHLIVNKTTLIQDHSIIRPDIDEIFHPFNPFSTFLELLLKLSFPLVLNIFEARSIKTFNLLHHIEQSSQFW
jgi:hypothetical protein